MKEFGYVIASRMLVDNRLPVMFMYRERPQDGDSGWRFLCGLEEQAYLDDPDNVAIYDVDTIREIDPSVEIYLGSLPRRAYARNSPEESFFRVMDFDFDREDPEVEITGTALASRMLVEKRLPVMVMYRVEPEEEDTGWRFYSGLENDEYLSDPANLEEYDIHTIMELDPAVVPYVALEGVRAYERTDPLNPHFDVVTFDDADMEDESDRQDE